MNWRPIETAPKDGTDILVLINSATVWVVHIAFWRDLDARDLDEVDDRPERAGWWSYIRHSVTQERLDEYSKPLYWMPFEEPEGWKYGSAQ